MFTIYAASAGSGKTFILSKQFLKLALSNHWNEEKNALEFNPYYYRHILAVTFTNDAAHEMKERIMETLEGISKYPDLAEDRLKKIDSYREIILKELAGEGVVLTEDELKRRARDTFHVLLHHYSDFTVSTIDSFTQRVVAAFTEELGIPYNFEVSLDTPILIAAAVEQLLAKVGQAEFEQLTAVLEELVGDLADKGKSWNRLDEEVAKVGNKLLEDKHREALIKLSELVPSDFMEIQRRIRQYLQTQETEYARLAQVAMDLITQKTDLSINDFLYGSSGAAGYMQKVSEGLKRFEEDIPNRLLQTAQLELDWLKKNPPAPLKAQFGLIQAELESIAREMIQFHDTRLPKFVLYQELDKQLHKLALLKQLSEEVRAIEDHSGQIHISRFNQSILKIVLEEPIPFLYERLGEKYKHILIDEFQDTSQVQWLNFMPLIDNSLAADEFNMVVGDAKQSIYRFRGGEMEQLVHLYQKDMPAMLNALGEANWNVLDRIQGFSSHIQPAQLDFNWRSRKEIVDFNNDFLEKILASQVDLSWEVTQRIYETFRQKSPDSQSCGGHVQVDFLIRKKEDTDDLTPEFIWQQIETCLAEGYTYKDIAILCRKNKHARLLADFLRTEKKIDIISADSLLLSSSQSIGLLIALLQVLESPDQALFKYEAAYLFCKEVLGTIPEGQNSTRIRAMVESPDLYAFWEWVNENLKSKRKEEKALDAFLLRRSGLYELCEELMQEFGMFEWQDELPYLFRFLDFVQDFSLRQSGHLSDFLQVWEQQKNKLCVNTPKGKNAVTIQSIHKSKGLDYTVVLLPYANWSYKPGFNDEIWGELGELPDSDELRFREEDEISRRLRIAPFSMVKNLSKTILKEKYEREVEQTFLDNLNLLYVALTRSVERLYVSMELTYSAKGELKGYQDTVGKFFVDYLEPVRQDGANIIKQGLSSGSKKKSGESAQSLILEEIVSVNRMDHLRLRRQTERITELDSFQTQKDWRLKAKAVLREIRTPDDVPAVIARMQQRGLLDDEQKAKMVACINQILKQKVMKPYFELPAEFLFEKEIIMPNGSTIRPDRVIIRPNQQLAILEYKIGNPADSHQKEMKKYASIYRKMGYKDVECWLVYLDSGEVVSIN
ncbi:MAG: UvrD-helicase domain-containing protein [Siphonobacter sp.]